MMQESTPTQLQSLAQAAVYHASEHYGWNLDPQRVDLVDQVLDGERKSNNVEDRSAVAMCYGAWLGEWAVAHVGARWVGVSEPTPPRVMVAGVPTSPMDAVARRLEHDQAPTMESLVRQWLDWNQVPGDDAPATSRNRSAWDARNNDPRFVLSGPIPETREDAVLMIDPWLRDEGDLVGRRILALAAGGGMHGPLLAKAGAEVTVVDFSSQQLLVDQSIAREQSLPLQTLKASMDALTPFSDESFDMVVHPVSTCYVRNVVSVYREVSRVLRPGGLYISQHKQPVSLQTWKNSGSESYSIQEPGDEGHVLVPSNVTSAIRENEMTEYIHTWETLVGDLCRCGFVVEDLLEPPRADAWAKQGTMEHRARFAPPYVKIKARKRS